MAFTLTNPNVEQCLVPCKQKCLEVILLNLDQWTTREQLTGMMAYTHSYMTAKAIRCTQQSCPCECFAPGKTCLRYCDTCNHGWVAHALDKLGYQHAYNLGMQVEVVQPNIVFDIASLMLYGSQATPVRLKILLDRLFSVLQHEEVLQVLHGFGWSYEDYARGYILQDSTGRVLDKWSMATRDEEHVILQQFLRFGETKAIAQEIILQDTRDKQDAYSKQTTRAESEIKKFIERSNLSMQSFMKMDPSRQMFGARTLPFVPGARILASPILTPSPYSPSREARPLSLTTTPAASSTPISNQQPASISRLQAYEFRRELGGTSTGSAPSPAPSPSAMDKVILASTTNTGMTVPTVVSTLAAAAVAAGTGAGGVAVSGGGGGGAGGGVGGSGRRSSPVMMTESPRNLSTTPSSVHSAPSPCVTPQKQALQSSVGLEMSGDLSEGCYSGGESDDDQSMGAIDYSTRDSDSPHTGGNGGGGNGSDAASKASAAAAAAARHLRKSNNPIKRQWIPNANFGSTFIGPNGKKRVLCTACNKTFCDKGALKIHYSAVHLKEMHKCTVEGCNMMFSSRRSRNRHSANPNPKLHMPQKRKELEGLDDEGKPISGLGTISGSTSLSSSPSMVVAPGLVAAAHQRSLEAAAAGGLLRTDPTYFMELGAQFPFVSPPESKRIKLESQDAPTDLSSSGVGSERGKTNDDTEKREPGTQRGTTTSPNSHNATVNNHHHYNNNNGNDTSAEHYEQRDVVEMETDAAAGNGPAVNLTDETSSSSSSVKGGNGGSGNGTGNGNGSGNDVGSQRGSGNRRKSNAPTRCAQKDEPMMINDDNSDDKRGGNNARGSGSSGSSSSARVANAATSATAAAATTATTNNNSTTTTSSIATSHADTTAHGESSAGQQQQQQQQLISDNRGRQQMQDDEGEDEEDSTAAMEGDAEETENGEGANGVATARGDKKGRTGGALHFPQIASLLLASKEQREREENSRGGGGQGGGRGSDAGGDINDDGNNNDLDDDDDDSDDENGLVINGDLDDEDIDDEIGGDDDEEANGKGEGEDDEDDGDNGRSGGGGGEDGPCDEDGNGNNDDNNIAAATNGDDGEAAGAEEEDDEDEDGAENDDNDHNHNNVSREDGGGDGDGGEDGGDSCDSVPSPSSDSGAVLEPGSELYGSKDSPRKCSLCGKLFQNQFSVKIHVQNVHLKLMHGCTVDGCTAAFPSKRSRDRHSSNLNLHRKLMSGGESGLDSSADPTLRDDILSTLYGATQLVAVAAAAAAAAGGGVSDSGGVVLREDDAAANSGSASPASKSSEPVDSPHRVSNINTNSDNNTATLSAPSVEPNETDDAVDEKKDDTATRRRRESMRSHLASNSNNSNVTATGKRSLQDKEGEKGGERAEGKKKDSAAGKQEHETGSRRGGEGEDEAEGGGIVLVDGKQKQTSAKDLVIPHPPPPAASAPASVSTRRDDVVCMSRKPVCCGMTFHTESALKEHYDLSHPSQPLKTARTAAAETLLASRRSRPRPRYKNGMHRLVSTGRKNGFS